jgi:hypothetical protein
MGEGLGGGSGGGRGKDRRGTEAVGTKGRRRGVARTIVKVVIINTQNRYVPSEKLPVQLDEQFRRSRDECKCIFFGLIFFIGIWR